LRGQLASFTMEQARKILVTGRNFPSIFSSRCAMFLPWMVSAR
jgi:hypothetical protein